MNQQVVHRVECQGKTDHGGTRSVKPEKGIGQGYCLSLILFDMYSEQHTKEAIGGFGGFKIRVRVICTVKHADDPVLLAKEEMVLQGLIDRLIEIGRYHGMEMSVEKMNVMRISRQSSPMQVMIETTGDFGIFQHFGQHDNKRCKMHP